MPAKGKRRANAAAEKPLKKRRNVNRQDVDDELRPAEQIPALMNAIRSRNGSTPPTFLYGKTLTNSDVDIVQNRLLVRRSKRMMGFLTGDDIRRGLKIDGVDSGGNAYDDLMVTRWSSMVINANWKKVVAANNAEKGDLVEIWGFRVGAKPCLAINFTKRNFDGDGTTGIDDCTSSTQNFDGSSGTSGIGDGTLIS